MSISEGYLALCVSILRKVPPEKAFRLLGNDRHCKNKELKQRKRWEIAEIIQMDIMRKSGDGWNDIGKSFGISGKHARSLVSYRLEGK